MGRNVTDALVGASLTLDTDVEPAVDISAEEVQRRGESTREIRQKMGDL
jgi:hypothetical protein